MASLAGVKAFWSYYGKTLTFFIIPILMIPVPLAIPSQEGRAGYLLLVMGVFWCAEVIPLGITALIPIALVPLFGIMSTKEVCKSYFEHISVMLLGGMFVAIAVEKCNLHRRIATKVLLLIGTSPRWLMLGFMVPTWFLSMWINNTATTAMMMPIVQEVLSKLQEVEEKVKTGQILDNDPEKAPEQRRASLLFPQSYRKYSKGELPTVESTAELMPYGPVGVKASPVPSDNEDDPTDMDDKKRVYFDSNSPPEYRKTSEYRKRNPSGISNHSFIDEEDLSFGGTPYENKLVNDMDIPDVKVEEPSAIDSKEEKERSKRFELLEKSLILCVAYAANAGGTGTLIGTTPNLVLKGQADQIWADHDMPTESPVNFATWMVIGFPISLINMIIIWIWLEVYFIGPKEFFRVGTTPEDRANQKSIRFVIKKEYEKLGPFKTDEIQLLVLFCVLVLFWFMRSPDFIPGWASLFPKGYTSDAIPVVAVLIMMFAIPVSYPKNSLKEHTCEYLLDWASIKQKFAWDVVLLVGGGFALAECTMRSGLSAWIGEQLIALGALPDALLLFVLGFLVTLITQVTSNVASATLLLPIGASMAEQLGKNPLYLMFCITISVQYAFMLPVATPPNAVAFSTGKLKVMDLVKAGAALNIFCVLVMTLGIQTWVYVFFQLDVIPWPTNGTDILVPQTGVQDVLVR